MIRRPVLVAAAVLLQVALVGGAVAPQLSARTGEEYRFRVGPVDPMEPLRGAYVALDYPDLLPREAPSGDIIGTPLPTGRVFVPVEVRDGVAHGRPAVRDRPASGPYLAYDSSGHGLDCGIGSWFVPQEEAARLDRSLRDRTAVATVRIDARGNAALVDLDATPAQAPTQP